MYAGVQPGSWFGYEMSAFGECESLGCSRWRAGPSGDTYYSWTPLSGTGSRCTTSGTEWDRATSDVFVGLLVWETRDGILCLTRQMRQSQVA